MQYSWCNDSWREKNIYLCTVSVMIMGGGIIIYFGTVHERKEMTNGEGSKWDK